MVVLRGCTISLLHTKLDPESAETVCTPLLRWAGSKRAEADTLAALWRPEFKRYIEPFCGSAALYFRLAPEKAILSDINRELIAFYRTVSTEPVEVYRKFHNLPRRRSTYYHLRKEQQHQTDPIMKAAIFLYLNKNCFNGLYRTNRNGAFNVPFSDNRVGRYPTEEEFLRSCKLISRARVQCGDFAGIITRTLRPGDFVYLDPPYASSARLPFREYYPDSFGIDDIGRLEKLLLHIAERGAHFVLSYADSTAIAPIAATWNSTTCRVRRNISGFSSSRRVATEQVITNIT